MSEEIFVAEYLYCLPKEDEVARHLHQFTSSNGKLTARQKRTMGSLPTDQTFSVHDYKRVAAVSAATARRDIKDLIGKGMLIQKGHGKNTLYRMAEKL